MSDREEQEIVATFIQAIKQGKVDVLEKLSSSVDLTFADNNGETLLMTCAKHGNVEVMNYLLDFDEVRNTINRVEYVQGWTSLHFSAGEGNALCFERLLANGANPEILDLDNFSVLHLAAFNGNTSIIDVCVGKLTDNVILQLVQPTRTEQETPLALAIRKRYLGFAKSLIDQIPILHCGIADINGYTPLILAAKCGDASLVSKILKSESGLTSRNASSIAGKTALMYSAKRGFADVVQELLNCNVNVDLLSDENCTAILYALERGHIDIVKLLLKHGCDIHTGVVKELKFVEYCTVNGYENILDYARQIGVELTDPYEIEVNLFPLFEAVASGDLESVRSFASENPEELTMQVETTLETALHKACSLGDVDIVTELLKHTAHVDMKDAFGRTPLHVAKYARHEVIAKLLLSAGADPTTRDMFGICAGIINDQLAAESILVSSVEVTKAKFLRDTFPRLPKGRIFEASFRNKTVVTTEYPIRSSMEVIETAKRIRNLIQNLPSIYNRITPTLDRQNPEFKDKEIFSIFPKILGMYFEPSVVGIVQEALPQSAPFEVQSKEGRNTMLKMDLSINFLMYLNIMHQHGVVHGNLGKASVNRTPTNHVILHTFGLPCTVDFFSEENTIAPEVKSGGYTAINPVSDTYSAGVLLFELFYQQDYSASKQSYDIDTAKVTLPPKINMIIIPLLRPDFEIRANLAIALEALLKYRGELVSISDVSSAEIPDIIKEVGTINLQNHVLFTRSVKAKLDAYSFIDRKVLLVTYSANAQLSKCIAKIKETLGDIQLTEGESRSLDALETYLCKSSTQCTLSEDTFSMLVKLFKMKDQFMVLDLMRLVVLDKQALGEMLVRHTSVMDALLSLLRKYNDLSTNAKLMINRVLCNLSADENGRRYLTLAENRDLVASSIRLGLLCKVDNDKTLPSIRLGAASTALNLRYNLHKSNDGNLSLEIKKLVASMLISMKSTYSSFGNEILVNLCVTLYTLMKNDDQILDYVSTKSDFNFASDVREKLDTEDSNLASAISALMTLKETDFSL